jgi:FkbM family methyltransferase
MPIREVVMRSVVFNVSGIDAGSNKKWDEIEQGKWEPQTFRILANLLDKNHCALEVGIDTGQTSLFTASIVDKFIAVEPSLASIETANELFKLNPKLLDKTILLHGALSNTRDQVFFGKGSKLFDDIHFGSIDPQIFVQGYLIEDLESIVEQPITFINMDIEGGEYICLGTMIPWLRKNRPILLLSLHPGFLLNAKQARSNVLIRYLKRVKEQSKIYKSISFYPYIYDAVTLRRILPPSVFKLKYLRSKSAHNSQILCTNFEIKNINSWI